MPPRRGWLDSFTPSLQVHSGRNRLLSAQLVETERSGRLLGVIQTTVLVLPLGMTDLPRLVWRSILLKWRPQGFRCSHLFHQNIDRQAVSVTLVAVGVIGRVLEDTSFLNISCGMSPFVFSLTSW